MQYWGENEAVDGAGLAVEDHAKAIADKLNLSEEQRSLLCSELGNALLPALNDAERKGALGAAKQIERLFALHKALADKGRA